jgi:ABC-type glycerol-3-phosphate transport system substrate-binding protein
MNQVPDFIIASNRTIAEFARKGALVNLDFLMNDATIGLREEDRADFFPGFLDAGRLPDLKNQFFALPFDDNAVVLYYNANLLKAAKAEVPPRTWDQFGTAARSTTKGNVRGWAMSPSAAIFYACLFSRGGSVLATQETQTQARFNDDAGIKSLQLIAALSKGDAAYLADSADSVRADFAQEKAALFLGTVDDLTPLADAMTRANSKFQWGVTNIPQNDVNRPVTAIFGADIAIFKPVPSGANGTTDDRTRAAWLFARWLAAPEQTARWARTTFSIPVRVSAQTLLATNPPPQLQRLRDGFGDRLPMGRPLPNVKDAGLIDAAMVEMWMSVANDGDPAAALRNATTHVNRILGVTP